jgi:galactoside O-acetyltransferase
MITSFYSQKELLSIGFASLGNNVKISKKTSIYGAEHMSIGNNVRIDDFCILSGNIAIGSNIHISAYVALYGSGGITLEDYTGISPRSTVYSAMDDFSGDCLIGPIHPTEYTNVHKGQVIIKKYAQIGTHSVVFPNITIGEGSVVGAMTLVNKSLDAWGIYVGQPAKFLKTRKKGLLKFLY